MWGLSSLSTVIRLATKTKRPYDKLNGDWGLKVVGIARCCSACPHDSRFVVRIVFGNAFRLQAYALAFEKAFRKQECPRVLGRCIRRESCKKSGKAAMEVKELDARGLWEVEVFVSSLLA